MQYSHIQTTPGLRHSNLLSGSAIPVEDPPDLLEPRLHVALLPVVRRLVVAAAAQLVGQVLLRDDPDVGVVRIDVALAVAEPLRSG
jgi:hypothetical protein